MGFIVAMIGVSVVWVGMACVMLTIRNRQRVALGDVEARSRWQQGTERYAGWLGKFLIFVLAAQFVLVPLMIAAFLWSR
jgi:hypothetical protein